MWRLWQLIGNPWRRRFGIVMGLSVLASASEIMSIGSLLSFLAVLTNPEALARWPILGQWLHFLGLTVNPPTGTVIVSLGLLFGVLILVASLIRWCLIAACSFYAHQLGGAIGQDIFKTVLSQPYAFHLTNTSNEIFDTVTSRVQMVVNTVLMAGLQVVTSSVMLLAIVSMLFLLNAWLTGAVLFGFGAVYFTIYRVSRQRLRANSERMAKVSTARFQFLQEGIGGIRDIYINGTQDYFINAFRQADDAFRDAQSRNAIISASPRYLVEGLGTFLLTSISIIYVIKSSNATAGTEAYTEFVPMLGVLVFAFQRILPLMQQIFAGWTKILGMLDTLRIVVQWMQLRVSASGPEKKTCDVDSILSSAVLFEKTLELIDVNFSYQEEKLNILKQLNLKISKGQMVGLMGASGAGKSTLLDILMGLLPVTSGHFLIDGEVLIASNRDKRGEGWRRQIAHVPQHIFLANASIASNIAFGCQPEFIDNDRLHEAVKQAGLSQVVEKLPKGIQTTIGEGGLRLSGGQQQRLGIARALYKRANLLVLDEATNALDPTTEEEIVKSLSCLTPDLTIVMVSHRLSALKYCDVVYRLENGRLVAI